MNSFADFFWYMVEFYILFMIIWIFIRVFADIFRRTDLTGGWKAIWILVIFIVPFFGALVYIISRPRTEGDLQWGAATPDSGSVTLPSAAPTTAASAADEVAKLSALHDAGTLTDAEFETAKARALA